MGKTEALSISGSENYLFSFPHIPITGKCLIFFPSVVNLVLTEFMSLHFVNAAY